MRLKNFIEFRHWDSLPIERVERLTEIIASLYYVPSNRIRLESYFDGLTEEDVFEAKANIQAHGRESTRMASRSTSGVSSSASRACSTIFPEIRSTPTCSSADRVPCRP